MTIFSAWIAIAGTGTGNANFRQLANYEIESSDAMLAGVGSASIVAHGSTVNILTDATEQGTPAGDIQGRLLLIARGVPDAIRALDNNAEIEWAGTIVADEYDRTGNAHLIRAEEIGKDWTNVAVTNWQASTDGITPFGMPGLQFANIAQPDGSIVGNKFTGTASVSWFALDPSDITGKWTRRELLDHIAQYAAPTRIDIQYNTDTFADAILTAEANRSWPLANMSLQGLLNMLCGADSGLIWWAEWAGQVATGANEGLDRRPGI
jgi:hypothetical protein